MYIDNLMSSNDIKSSPICATILNKYGSFIENLLDFRASRPATLHKAIDNMIVEPQYTTADKCAAFNTLFTFCMLNAVGNDNGNDIGNGTTTIMCMNMLGGLSNAAFGNKKDE